MLIRLATSWLKRHGKKPPQAYWTPCVMRPEGWNPNTSRVIVYTIGGDDEEPAQSLPANPSR